MHLIYLLRCAFDSLHFFVCWRVPIIYYLELWKARVSTDKIPIIFFPSEVAIVGPNFFQCHEFLVPFASICYSKNMSRHVNSGNCCLLFAAGSDQAFHPPKNPMPFFSLGNSHQNMQWLKRWVDQWTKDRNMARAQYAGNFCNSSCSSWPNSCRLAMKKLQQEVI